VSGVALSGNSLDLDSLDNAQKQILFSNAYVNTQSVGIDVDFSSSDLQIDDTFRLDLTKTPQVHITEVGVGGAGTFIDIPQDFGDYTFDLNNRLVDGIDPGFDLVITDAVLGQDDSYRISLTGAEVAAANTNLIKTNARTLQVGDEFNTNLIADTLEIGTQYSLGVTAPHLNAGHSYNVTENVGTLKVGEQLTVGSLDSRFEPTVYTMQSSVTITDGLNLNFSANGPFEVGDEIRFQARGYRGDYSVAGQYTDPAYPTTFEVEVIQTGDVDGGALLRTTRLDSGALVSDNVSAVSTADTANIGGDGYLGLGVFMQFDANNGAGEAHRLYQGDIFYVDVVGSLSQNFGSQVALESDENIDIEYSVVDVDNQIGRLLYVGDASLVNNPGTLDSLQSAFLGVNTEFSVSKLSLLSQEEAEDAMRLVDDAIEQISTVRTRNGAAQNRMHREMASLEESLFQTERYQSQIRDADVALEVARQTKALIVQRAGVQMLRQINDMNTLGLALVRTLIN
jgi:flagellin-like hook-associated protein FlgL